MCLTIIIIVVTRIGNRISSENCPIVRLIGRIYVYHIKWRKLDQYWRSFDLYKRNIPRIFVPKF